MRFGIILWHTDGQLQAHRAHPILYAIPIHLACETLREALQPLSEQFYFSEAPPPPSLHCQPHQMSFMFSRGLVGEDNADPFDWVF